jgi:pimeloyl-ACP methyl ester carboxylesterase
METLCFEPGTSAAANAFDIEDHLARLRTPTLVLCSDHDWNLKHHDRLVAAIAQARPWRFAGAHPLHALNHPERAQEYVDAIDVFLRDVLTAGPAPPDGAFFA